MISFIKSLLFKNNDKEEPHDDDEEDTTINNSITFCVGSDGEVYIDMKIAHIDDKSCEKFSKMLFHINKGHYQKTLLDIMVDLTNEHEELVSPIESIMANWGLMIAMEPEGQNTNTNKPFIRPRNAFLGK